MKKKDYEHLFNEGKTQEEANKMFFAETIWRLTTHDFLCYATELYPNISEDELTRLYEYAKEDFYIDGWDEHVKMFVESTLCRILKNA